MSTTLGAGDGADARGAASGRALLVDTSAWIALESANDVNHDRALAFARGEGRNWRWVTTNWVLAETATFLRRHTSHAATVRFLDRISRSTALTRLQVTDADETRAWEIFRAYDDKVLSLVDCSSFAVMESRGMATAFTFDRDFRQYGFSELPHRAVR